MSKEVIKVGFIGAGTNTTFRHIPGFRAMPNVELVGVANRSIESSKLVAEKYEIKNIYNDWMDLVEDPEIDAICIGTWPYMHSIMTTTALEFDKHVLCEARMAANAIEAREMLHASQLKPNLITQIVPPPHLMHCEAHLIDMISEGYLGDIINVNIRVSDGSAYPDSSTEVHWRQIREYSGNNVMFLGIWYENLMRLVGPANSVMAQSQVVVKQRPNWDGEKYFVSIPDQIDVIYSLTGGGNVNLSMSSVSGPFSEPMDLWIYGSRGTIRIRSKGPNELPIVEGASKGEKSMSIINIPLEKQGKWRVEEEFINAIRGKEQISRSNFVDSLKYMEFTDAVQESWQTGSRIYLPLV